MTTLLGTILFLGLVFVSAFAVLLTTFAWIVFLTKREAWNFDPAMGMTYVTAFLVYLTHGAAFTAVQLPLAGWIAKLITGC